MAEQIRVHGKNRNRFYYTLIWISALIGFILPLGITIYLIIHGSIVMTPEFLFDRPKGSPLGSEGGIFPAIAGSFSLTLIGLIIAFPAAISSALYLTQFARSEKIKGFARLTIEALAGIPSIIYGLFGYAFFVVLLKMGTSLGAGSLVLAIVMYPIILITAQEAFEAVGMELKEATYSLGVDGTAWISRVLIPKSIGRIIAGVVLAVGHAMGSAAPVLFTAAVYYSRGTISFSEPVMTLPTHLYFLVSEGVSFDHAYGTALVLVLGLMIFNGIAMILRHNIKE